MAKANLRRFDVQAKLGLILSLISVLGMIGVGVLLVRNFRPDIGAIMFSNKAYKAIIMVGVALTLLVAAAGTALGANSAGQKRNDKSSWSWLAFFVGGMTVALTLVLFFGFWKLKFELVGS